MGPNYLSPEDAQGARKEMACQDCPFLQPQVLSPSFLFVLLKKKFKKPRPTATFFPTAARPLPYGFCLQPALNASI